MMDTLTADRIERARMRADYLAEGIDLSTLHASMFGDDAIADEHVAEHFDDVVMDCPLCVGEWEEVTK